MREPRRAGVGGAAFPLEGPVTGSLGQSGRLDQPSQEVAAVAAVLLLSGLGEPGPQGKGGFWGDFLKPQDAGSQPEL